MHNWVECIILIAYREIEKLEIDEVFDFLKAKKANV